VDDYVKIFASNSLQITDQITVEAWINPRQATNFALFKETVSGNGDWWIILSGSWYCCTYGGVGTVNSGVTAPLNQWIHVVLTYTSSSLNCYINGILKGSDTSPGKLTGNSNPIIIAGYPSTPTTFFNGIIDEVRIYNRALSAEEIKAHYEKGEPGQTSISVKKEASPYSIRQHQTTTVTIQIQNTGTSEIRDVEVVDSTNSNLDLVGGEFPNPKKYDSLRAGESREIQYTLKSKESGTFILDPVTVSYADDKGNIKVVKSEPASLTVVPSSEGAPETTPPSEPVSSAVLLHGEKTDVVLGEDILLKLSAVNLINKPPMTVQVILYPPSGMSVTGSEFVKSGAGIYTTTYTLNPGDGKDIEVHIKSNQIGDFNVKGRIVYYFGEDKKSTEDPYFGTANQG
jgi:hypothetical protein